MAGAGKAMPTWRDVKVEHEQLDRAGLLGLLKDLHGVSRDNQAFLHARLGLGAHPLEPYKNAISRWIAPDVMKDQQVSVVKAKKAIADYRKAIDLPRSPAGRRRAFGLLLRGGHGIAVLVRNGGRGVLCSARAHV